LCFHGFEFYLNYKIKHEGKYKQQKGFRQKKIIIIKQYKTKQFVGNNSEKQNI